MHEKYKIVTPISHVPVIHPAIFYDNGACTFNYEADGDGDDWAASYHLSYAHSCLKGILLQTKATDPTIGDAVYIRKYVWLPPTKLMTLDFLFSNLGTATRYIFSFALHWYDGTSRNAAIIRCHQAGSAVARWTDGVNYTQVDSMVFNREVRHWNHAQLSVRLDTPAFHFLTVNHQVADLRTVALPTTPSGVAPHVEIYFSLETAANAAAAGAIDHVLLMPGNP